MRAHHLRGCDRNAWILFHAVQPLSREPCQVKECHATHTLGHLPTIRIETRATPALLSATENTRVIRTRDRQQSQSSMCRARRRDCRGRRSPYLCVCHSTAKPIAPVRARDLRYDRLAISPELPKPGKSSTRSHQDKQGRRRTFLILPLRISLHARGIMFSKSSCIMSPNHLRRSHASPGLKVGRMGGERPVLCRCSVRAEFLEMCVGFEGMTQQDRRGLYRRTNV